MKKLFMLLLTLSVVLIGCSSVNEIQDFNQGERKDKMEELSFQPQLPTQLPFNVVQKDISIPPKVQGPVEKLTFDFYGEGKEHISLLTFGEGTVSSSLEEEYEEVQIEERTGKYFENDSGNKTLRWEQGGIHYIMKSFSEHGETSITKEDLIKVSESFES